MTQPQSKLHRHTAIHGEFVLQAGKEAWETMDLDAPDPKGAFENCAHLLPSAIAKVDMLLEFWSQMQRSRAPLGAINDNWLVYKALKMWPRSER